MAFKVVTGAAYHDNAQNVPRQKGSSVSSQTGAENIHLTEAPEPVKTTGNNQTGKEQENGQKQSEATDKQIKQAIDRANNKMKEHRTRCEFSYHEDTKRVSIKVYDEETEEVVREIPPEKTLEMVEKMWELAGLLVDEKR